MTATATKPWKLQSTDERLDSLKEMIETLVKRLAVGTAGSNETKTPFSGNYHTYTYEEAGIICHRATKTIKNTVCKLRIPHKIIRGPGSQKIYIAVLDAEGLERLRKRFHGY